MAFDVSLVLMLFGFASVAAFIQRVSGFGFGICIMTVLPFIIPSYGEATTLSGTLAMTQSMFVAYKMREFIVWRRVLPMLAIFLVVSYICIGFISKTDTDVLVKVLGVTLILLSIYFLFFSNRIHIKQSIPMQLFMGSISGVLGGFFGMQGPPAVLYYVESEPTKNHYAAQTQVYFVCGNLFMTLVRAHNGFLTMDVCKSWVIAIFGVIVGTAIGTYIFNKISADILKKIIYGYIAICGLIFLFK